MGGEIKEIRKATGLSQSKFAAKFNISIRTLQEWEQGRKEPAEYVIKMIEKIIEMEEKKYMIKNKMILTPMQLFVPNGTIVHSLMDFFREKGHKEHTKQVVSTNGFTLFCHGKNEGDFVTLTKEFAMMNNIEIIELNYELDLRRNPNEIIEIINNNGDVKNEIITKIENMIKEKEREETTDTYCLQSKIGFIDGMKKALEILKN